MREHRSYPTFILAGLLLLTILIPIIPGEEAEYNGSIGKDEYWFHEIERPTKDDDQQIWDIKVNSTGQDPYDVYILVQSEFENYENGRDFKARWQMENITNTEVHLKWTVEGKDTERYLVVDNMDNSHPGDAYANGTIVVNISIEKAESEIAGTVLAAICGMCSIAILVVIGILLWIVMEPRYFPQSKSKKLLNLTRKPAFQHMPINPKVEMAPGRARTQDRNTRSSPPRHPSSAYPPPSYPPPPPPASYPLPPASTYLPPPQSSSQPPPPPPSSYPPPRLPSEKET